VATYSRIVLDFLSFLAHSKVRLRRLIRDDLRAYVVYLCRERHNSSRSVRLKLQAIKAFLAFLAEHIVNAAPKLSLGGRDFSYKVEQKDVESLSEQQLAKLLEIVADSSEQTQTALETTIGKTTLCRKRLFAVQRDLALVALLIATGLRIAEALAIGLGDIDFVDRSILIHGKGKKLRRVFFDLEGLSRHLLPYIEARRVLQLDHDRLFVEIKTFAPLQSRGFQKRLKVYVQKAGLRRSITPHSLRHSFATVAIEKGANIKAVSQILGHANCKITIDLYTHLSSEHLRAVMQRCNPLSTEVIPIEERIEMRKKHLPYLERTG
jgi:site-specific recombinase XerD